MKINKLYLILYYLKKVVKLHNYFRVGYFLFIDMEQFILSFF